MSGQRTPFSPTFAVDPLLPPPRPPRLRPPSRSSSVGTDPDSATNSGVWPDVTLATLVDQEDKLLAATYYKHYIRESFMDMDSTETISPVRDSPMLGARHKLLPEGDRSGASSELKRDRSFGRHSDGHPPPNNRSKLRSVCLVLSCTGAMIINVSPPRIVLCARSN